MENDSEDDKGLSGGSDQSTVAESTQSGNNDQGGSNYHDDGKNNSCHAEKIKSDDTSQNEQQKSTMTGSDDETDVDFLDCPTSPSPTDNTLEDFTGGNDSEMVLSIPFHTGMYLGMNVNCSKFAISSTNIIGQDGQEEINQTIALYSFPKTMEDVCKLFSITPVYAKKVEAGVIKDDVVKFSVRNINEISIFTAIFFVRYTKVKSILSDSRNPTEKDMADEELFIQALSMGNQLVVIMKLFSVSNPDEEVSIREDYFPNVEADYGDIRNARSELQRSMTTLQDKMNQSRHRDLRCIIQYGTFSKLERYPGRPVEMLQTIMGFISMCERYEEYYSKNECPKTCNVIPMKLVNGNVDEDKEKQAQVYGTSERKDEFDLYYVQAILCPTKPVSEDVRRIYEKMLSEIPKPEHDEKPPIQRPMTKPASKKLPPGQNMAFMVFGKTGHGKSATANTLIGEKVFKTSSHASSETLSSESYCQVIDDRQILIVDTPGICGTSMYDDRSVQITSQGLATAMKLSPIGFDALLFVIAYGNRMTSEEMKAIQQLKVILGNNVFKKHCILVVTFKDAFERDNVRHETFRNWCKSQKGNLETLFKECMYRCLAVNNKTENLLEKKNFLIEVVTMVGEMKIQKYTNIMFEQTKPQRKLLDKELKLKSMHSVMTNLERNVLEIIRLSNGYENDKEFAVQLLKEQQDMINSLISQKGFDRSMLYAVLPMLNIKPKKINWATDRVKLQTLHEVVMSYFENGFLTKLQYGESSH